MNIDEWKNNDTYTRVNRDIFTIKSLLNNKICGFFTDTNFFFNVGFPKEDIFLDTFYVLYFSQLYTLQLQVYASCVVLPRRTLPQSLRSVPFYSEPLRRTSTSCRIRSTEVEHGLCLNIAIRSTSKPPRLDTDTKFAQILNLQLLVEKQSYSSPRPLMLWLKNKYFQKLQNFWSKQGQLCHCNLHITSFTYNDIETESHLELYSKYGDSNSFCAQNVFVQLSVIYNEHLAHKIFLLLSG